MPGDAWRCRKSPNAASLRLGKAKASLRSRLWIYCQDEGLRIIGFNYIRRPSDLRSRLWIYSQDRRPSEFGFWPSVLYSDFQIFAFDLLFEISDFRILAFSPRPKA